MGQEIQKNHFHKQDFGEFQRRLSAETALLARYFDERAFAADALTAGFEMEAWLVNEAMRPLPENERFLQIMDSAWLSPELARFNIELNGQPRPLHGDALSRMQAEFEQLWHCCGVAAQEIKASLMMVGILPTLQEHEVVLDNMSAMRRYRALNEQIRRLRDGRPLRLDIKGREQHLKTWDKDVMLESAATSFQLHLQVPQQQAARAYNAALVASAPLVALSANSPYLFGLDLWDETRIPVFEQAVSIHTDDNHPYERVTFGSGYLRNSLFECFEENLRHHPVLLPEKLSADPARLEHLRLHNGTIWRWNRPLIGFSDDGKPHLRIEHRVIPAGPSIVDSFANAAMFYGLIAHWLEDDHFSSSQLKYPLPFADARANFYAAAQYGLAARIRWFNKQHTDLHTLWQSALLDQARQGLIRLNIQDDDIDRYVEVIAGRLASHRNGTGWQRAFVAKHGRNMMALTEAYYQHQASGLPVHEWSI